MATATTAKKSADCEAIDLTGPETFDLTKDDEDNNNSNGTEEEDSSRSRKRRRRQDDIVDNNPEVAIVQDDETKKFPARPAFFDCAVCLEKIERFRGFQLGSCLHSFCRPCLHCYIHNQLVSDKDARVVCPDASCKKRLSTADVRACTIEVGDKDLWRTFQELSTESYMESAIAAAGQPVPNAVTPLSTQPQLRLHRCPTNRCNFTFEFDDSVCNTETPQQQHREGQLFTCPWCTKAYCLFCPAVGGDKKVGPAHDHSCAEVLEEMRLSEERRRKLEEWKTENSQADARFQQLLEREGATGETKPCPSCRTPITKNGGCNHMYCTNCKTDFNWA